MSESGEESKDEFASPIIDINEKVSRSDFLRKVIAGGAISVAAISGLGGLQKVFGDLDSNSHKSGNGGNTDIASLIQQVNKLRDQLGNLQSQFAQVISGKLTVPEMVVDKLTTSDGAFIKLTIPSTENGYMKINAESTFHKLTVPENGFLKIDGMSSFLKLEVPEQGYMKIVGDSAFLKLTVPDNGFLKIDGESAFLKLTVPDNGFLKIDGESAFLKLTVPENGFLKIDGESAFLKLTVPENGFLKLDGMSSFLKLDVPENGFLKVNGEASFLKLDATEVVAQKVVAGSITTQTPTTAG